MNKSIIVAVVSVVIATLLSVIYLYNHREAYAVINWGMAGFVYVGLQFFVAIVLRKSYVGKGLLIGSGIILLIGVSICSSGLVR